MAKKHCTSSPPTSYELLGLRSQRIINSPRAQQARHAAIEPQQDESAEDWDRLLEEFETLKQVTMTRHEDESVELCWNPEEAME